MNPDILKELLTQPSAPLKEPGYLWNIAIRLPANVDVEGVRYGAINAILSRGNEREWTAPLTAAETRASSWDQILDADEAPLRALTAKTANPIVAARLEDVVATRFRDFRLLRSAASKLVAAAAACDPDTMLLDVVYSLGRAAQAALQLNDAALKQVICNEVERVGLLLAALPDPSAFIFWCNDFSLLVACNPKFSFPNSARWAWSLMPIAFHLFRSGEANQARDVCIIAQSLFRGAGMASLAKEVRRICVSTTLTKAQELEGLARLHQTLLARDDAFTWNESDLHEAAMKSIPDGITASIGAMGAVTAPVPISKEYAPALRAMADGPSIAVAVATLARAPDFLSPDTASFRKQAEKIQTNTLIGMLPSLYLRRTKVAIASFGPDAKLQSLIGEVARFHLTVVEAHLAIFLDTAMPRMEADTLVDATCLPALNNERFEWLQRAAERFAAQDFLSSGAIVLSQYEGVLRDALGRNGILVQRPSPDFESATMDRTFGTLLRLQETRTLLGEDHAWWVEFVLSMPDRGPNMRNEFAHGSLAPQELSRERLFLLWLFLIKLTWL